MVIIGARGFAKHLLHVLHENGLDSDLRFFDNFNDDAPSMLYDKFSVIKSFDELKSYFCDCSPSFALGVGGPIIRHKLSTKVKSFGGKLQSIISNSASVGPYGNRIDCGACILFNAIITADVVIGEGCIINDAAIISHDSKIGQYCEISPGAKILGRVTVGNFTQIGTNAVILPDVKVGSFCKVGAGAVVTNDIPDNSVVIGVPAKPLMTRNEI